MNPYKLWKEQKERTRDAREFLLHGPSTGDYRPLVGPRPKTLWRFRDQTNYELAIEDGTAD